MADVKLANNFTMTQLDKPERESMSEMLAGVKNVANMYNSNSRELGTKTKSRSHTIQVRGIPIACDILGESSSIPLVLTPFGNQDRTYLRDFASVLLDKSPVKLKILLWDRRNTGDSGISFESSVCMQHEEAEDLHCLLMKLTEEERDAANSPPSHPSPSTVGVAASSGGGSQNPQKVGWIPAVLMGSSSGARLSVILSLTHPQSVAGLILAPPTGGSILTARLLSWMYFLQYSQLALQHQSMQAVFSTPHFQDMLRNDPVRTRQLLETPLDVFVSAMDRAAALFAQTVDSPLLGVHESAFKRSIPPPTLVVHHGKKDALHSLADAYYISEILPKADLKIACEIEAVSDRVAQFLLKLVIPKSKL